MAVVAICILLNKKAACFDAAYAMRLFAFYPSRWVRCRSRANAFSQVRMVSLFRKAYMGW